MKDHLIFDTSSASTIVDSDSVGAFVRSSDGSLITKHDVVNAEKANLISQGLVFKSKLAGVIGNSYSFTVIDSTGSGPLSFTEVAGAIVLDLNGLTPTTAQVVAALAANTYVDISVGSPTGNVIVASIQSLSGGSDSSIHKHLDVYAPMIDGDGNSISSTNGALNVNVDNTVTVSATNLDIRDLVFATDKVDASGSVVKITDGTNQLVVNADGSINVQADIAVSSGSDKAEDSAHVSGDIGTYILAVRQDTITTDTSADGDYSSLKTSATGALYVNIAESSGSMTVSDAALANTAIIAAANTLSVANTAQVAVASPLASRKYLSIYNMDNKKIYIGGSGVTAGSGFPVSPGSYIEMRAGAASAVYFVGSTGATPEIRHLELS